MKGNENNSNENEKKIADQLAEEEKPKDYFQKYSEDKSLPLFSDSLKNENNKFKEENKEDKKKCEDINSYQSQSEDKAPSSLFIDKNKNDKFNNIKDINKIDNKSDEEIAIELEKEEKRIRIIEILLSEKEYKREIPDNKKGQERMIRSLMNVRHAGPIKEIFFKLQDEYLQDLLKEKGVIEIKDMTLNKGDLYIWQGDITRLKVDAIVNAANSAMTGCYSPCHNCIDNCIHSAAGIQLRNYCQEMMDKKGEEEETGLAEITPGFNLPSKYVIHTVGPIVSRHLTEEHCGLLAMCYESCLNCAVENNLDSIAFCCISTGVFGFPNKPAAEIAVNAVNNFKAEKNSNIKVIFNVFKDEDLKLYKNIFDKLK